MTELIEFINSFVELDSETEQAVKDHFKIIVFKPYLDFLNTTLQKSFSFNTFSNSEELIAKADYVISLGGDGTMLETLEFVRKSGIPVLGVNTGRLGFLATVYKEDFEKFIEGLDEAINHIKENAPEIDHSYEATEKKDSDISFEDLGN